MIYSKSGLWTSLRNDHVHQSELCILVAAIIVYFKEYSHIHTSQQLCFTLLINGSKIGAPHNSE